MPLPRISAAPPAPGPWTGFTQPPVTPQPQQPASRRRRSLRGLGIGLAALVIAAGIGFAPLIPSANGAGAAWTSFLPWTVLLLVLLGAAAVIRRAWWGLSAVIVAALVWSVVFVPQMLPASVPGGAQLTVATQNIGAANTDPLSSAQALVASGAGIVAVQEIVGSDATAFLDAQYGYNARVSTVGLWSQWPMSEPEAFDLGMGWARSFRVVVHHPQGDIAVYAVHLPSVRPRYTDPRDQAVNELAALVAADPADKVLVMGDLNTATTDPTLAALTDESTASLTDSREAVRGGFGFTWPAQFPLTRPDHVLGRGVTPVFDEVLAAGGSDHRAVLVGLNLQ
jgi:vancomycin resistance protein VanJ